MNTQATANALFALKEKMKGCPVNKSGTYNGNGRGKRVEHCANALQEAGWTRGEAYDMAYKAAPKKP
jgi:hypothetical protein